MSGRPEIEIENYYQYDPSTATAVVATALYGISLAGAVFQTIRHKAWIWFVMALAVAMEFIGFLFRIISTNDVANRNAYIIQFCLIILAPVLMAAAIYIVFGRILFHVVPPHARTMKLIWVPARFVTPIFVGFDIAALFIQTIGAVLVSATNINDEDAADKISRGRSLAMAGIAVQMAAFGVFTVIAIRFHFVSKRFVADVDKSLQMEAGEKKASVVGCSRKIRPNWRTILWVVNSSCVWILIRSVYRMIEFNEGREGVTWSHEWYMYVFDVIPMFLVCLGFNLAPPGAYLPFMGWRQPKSEGRLASSDTEARDMELQPSPNQTPYQNGQ